MVIVRQFTAADDSALRSVFRRAGEGSPSAELWGDEASEAAIYLDPYIEHAPQTLLLAVVDDELVGYLTGCLDASVLPTESERIDRAIREHALMRKAGPLRFFARATLDALVAKVQRIPTAGDFVDPRWPAHLHINVVPEVRGTGVAAALMHAWDEQRDAHGSPGCHLQTLVENERAVRFFEKHGFVRHGDAVFVPGIRDRGRRLHQLTMVRPAPE